jgi:hypothetical protein
MQQRCWLFFGVQMAAIQYLTRESGNREDGSSLIETALAIPLLLIMLLFAVDFGYFFLVASNLVTAARNAALYSTQGFSTPSQQQIPAAGTLGSLSDTSGVAGVAGGDLAGLKFNLSGSPPSPQVSVCSKAIGVTALKSSGSTTGYITNCSTYPSGTLSVTPDLDPESMNGMLLQRVDVVYTVALPITLRLFNFNIIPPVNFHWQIEMRAID